jgi:hypothetical protein
MCLHNHLTAIMNTYRFHSRQSEIYTVETDAGPQKLARHNSAPENRSVMQWKDATLTLPAGPKDSGAQVKPANRIAIEYVSSAKIPGIQKHFGQSTSKALTFICWVGWGTKILKNKDVCTAPVTLSHTCTYSIVLVKGIISCQRTRHRYGGERKDPLAWIVS